MIHFPLFTFPSFTFQFFSVTSHTETETQMIDSSILQGKRAAYFTLGCKLNFAETSAIGDQLRHYGVQTARRGEQADLCIVNTCSVTEVADHKCRQAIHRMVRQHPDAFVVVTGCYAQLQHQLLADIPGVDLVVGAEQRHQVVPRILQAFSEKTDTLPSVFETGHASGPLRTPRYRETETTSNDDSRLPTLEVQSFSPACSHGDRTRYFLKVQDGCNYFCTYCTIPMARGRSRNGSIESLVRQARQVAQEGGREIVITGVNIGDFGHSTSETFYDLVRQLDTVEGIRRYRISSIEPNLLTDEIIDFVASSRAFMPHFHIPLQSGSDHVLRLMHRRYDTQLFRNKIERILHVMPHAFIGVDVISGMRGEQPEHFEQACQFIQSLPIAQLHVFTYSERPGTRALQIPHVVTPREKHERTQRLLAISAEKTRQFYTSHIGNVRPVLFEHAPAARLMHGFTDNYIRVELPSRPDLFGTILPVRLGPLNPQADALTGETVNV